MKGLWNLRNKRFCVYIKTYLDFLILTKEEREVIMDFIESIKQFSERVSMLKDTISTEERAQKRYR